VSNTKHNNSSLSEIGDAIRADIDSQSDIHTDQKQKENENDNENENPISSSGLNSERPNSMGTVLTARS